MGPNHPATSSDTHDTLYTHLDNEPKDKDSDAWKKWQLELYRFKCDKERRSVRALRASNNRNILQLKEQLERTIASHEKLKKEEIAACKLEYDQQLQKKDQQCKELTQALALNKNIADFYKTAHIGDELNEPNRIKLAMLEEDVSIRDEEIQALKKQLSEQVSANIGSKQQEVKELEYVREIQLSVDGEISALKEERAASAQKIDKQAKKITELKEEKTAFVKEVELQNQRIIQLKTTINSLRADVVLLEDKNKKLCSQLGSTVKTAYKPKATYGGKANLTQRSLHNMLQPAAKAPSSKSATTSAYTSPAASPPSSSVSSPTLSQYGRDAMPVTAIPQKRPLSTTLSDKTNNVAASVASKKGKGTDITIKKENIPTNEQMPKKSPTVKPKQAPTLLQSKPQPSATANAGPSICNSRHRGDRQHMEGDTCMSCANFYGTEVLPANIDGRQLQVSGQDRVYLNSRHRYYRTERATTPPGFWELDFQSPEKP